MKIGNVVHVGGNMLEGVVLHTETGRVEDEPTPDGFQTWRPGPRKTTATLKVVTHGPTVTLAATVPVFTDGSQIAENIKSALINHKETRMKVRNKFYVATDKVTTDLEQQDRKTDPFPTARWTKPTLEDAIEHAEAILEKEPRREHVAIVRIVRIVRRKKAPLIVEKV